MCCLCFRLLSQNPATCGRASYWIPLFAELPMPGVRCASVFPLIDRVCKATKTSTATVFLMFKTYFSIGFMPLLRILHCQQDRILSLLIL